MNPSRAFIDGILKYKKLFREDPEAHNQFIYDEQQYLRNFVLGGDADYSDILDLNHFRSLECEIMDWADDTAYCLNDLVDSINAGFLRFERVQTLGGTPKSPGRSGATRGNNSVGDSRRESGGAFQQENRIVHSLLFIDRAFHSSLFHHEPLSLRVVRRSGGSDRGRFLQTTFAGTRFRSFAASST